MNSTEVLPPALGEKVTPKGATKVYGERQARGTGLRADAHRTGWVGETQPLVALWKAPAIYVMAVPVQRRGNVRKPEHHAAEVHAPGREPQLLILVRAQGKIFSLISCQSIRVNALYALTLTD